MKIILAEDNEMVRAMTLIHLQNIATSLENTLEIDEKTDGEGLALCLQQANGSYGFILTDNDMSSANDGIRVLEEIRSRGDYTPTILYTGRAFESQVKDAVKQMNEKYAARSPQSRIYLLAKPFNRDQLIAAILAVRPDFDKRNASPKTGNGEYHSGE